jgi:DNA-binding transcriptional ArsR family regulator
MVESSLLSALASPRRREILRIVWHDERAAGAIAGAMPDVTFGAVSLQLRALAHAGLVDVRRDGQQRLYRARRDEVGAMRPMLERMWDDALWKLKLAAELEDSRRGPRPARRRRSPLTPTRSSRRPR